MDKDLEQKLQSRLDINDILSGFWQSSKDSKSPEEYQAQLNKASKRFSTLLSQELTKRDEEWNKYTDMHDDAMLDQINELEDCLKEIGND